MTIIMTQRPKIRVESFLPQLLVESNIPVKPEMSELVGLASRGLLH